MNNKLLVVFAIVLTFVAGIGFAVWKKSHPRAHFSVAPGVSCLTIPTGSPSVAVIKNVCGNDIQFTVQWSGSKPPATMTYRIPGGMQRQIPMYDLTLAITTQGPPTFGIGPPGDIDVELRNTPGPNNAALLALNRRNTFGYIHAKIIISGIPPEPPTFPDTVDRVYRPPMYGDTEIMQYLTDHYKGYLVTDLRTEDDPQ